MSLFWVIVVLLVLIVTIKQIEEYTRGVKFRFGRYVGILNPGWRIVIPIFESYQKIDLRTAVVDVPNQDCITKDNISVKVNAVLYYKVQKAEAAVLNVEHYRYAVSQLAQTTLRDVIGEVELDELLTKRDVISKKIKSVVDKSSDPWGIKVEMVEVKHVLLPDNMQRVIGRQAEAMRERRAVIIKAEGEKIAAKNMADAAAMLGKAPGALHLRTLQTLNDLSSDQSNTVIIGIPLEVIRAFEGMTKK